jgi:eukaryotic-like serine/threonine-protein kinase
VTRSRAARISSISFWLYASASAPQVATPEPARARKWKLLAAIAAVVVVLAAGAIFFHFRQPQRLTEKDAIVLADFTNTTGDSVFDGTLRQGLSAQLEQSPFLNLLSDERISQTLSNISTNRFATSVSR